MFGNISIVRIILLIKTSIADLLNIWLYMASTLLVLEISLMWDDLHGEIFYKFSKVSLNLLNSKI